MEIEGGEQDLIRIIDFYNIRKIAMEVHTEWIGRDGVEAILGASAMRGSPGSRFGGPIQQFHARRP